LPLYGIVIHNQRSAHHIQSQIPLLLACIQESTFVTHGYIVCSTILPNNVISKVHFIPSFQCM